MLPKDSPLSPAFYSALSLLESLHQGGFEAYLVGGCVRDLLLGREISDFDITTSALPEEVEAHFLHTIPTGLRWGTMTVLWENNSYEVTTFRGESAYSDGRRPDSVTFGVSLEEDLRRRDFTINAMAYHPKHGLIDPFGGELDLEGKILRTVGVANQRFSEDYLRILRGLRFSATLGFVIEEETADAMHCNWEGLHQITRERITQEIRKLVMGDYLHHLTDFYPVLEEGIFFGIDCLWEAEDEGQVEEKLKKISQAPKLQSLRLALFLSLFFPDSAILKLSKEESQAVDFLCNATCLVWEDSPPFLEMIHTHGRDKMELLLFFQKYHFPYHAGELLALEETLGRKTCTSIKELNLSGQDLIDQGVAEGETIGKLLHIALDLVLAGTVENEKEALLSVMLGGSK